MTGALKEAKMNVGDQSIGIQVLFVGSKNNYLSFLLGG